LASTIRSFKSYLIWRNIY